MRKTDLLTKAIEIARKAHFGQVDKMGVDYIEHPLRVMQSVDTTTEKIVAVLHDVVEDTSITVEFICETFGDEIAAAVDAITKKTGQTYASYITIVSTNPIARKVKIADLTDNMDPKRGYNKNRQRYLKAYNSLMKYPQYYDVDGTKVKIDLDQKSNEVFGETNAGKPYPLGKARFEGTPITQKDFQSS